MKFIDEAKHWWRMFCMQCMAAAIGVQATWTQLPDNLKSLVPGQWVTYGTIAILVLGMVGRLVDQSLGEK
jgi:hypothetical protein